MKEYVIDFETRSPVDIKKAGAYKYAQHSMTDVLMLAVLDRATGKSRVWVGPNFRHLADTEISNAELTEIVTSADKLIAHNAPFERAIWEYVMVRRYKFPTLPAGKFYDTAVQCSMVGLPRSLELASAYFGKGEEKKDKEGSPIMRKFCSPRLATAKMLSNLKTTVEDAKDYASALAMGREVNAPVNGILRWHEDADDFKRVVSYCRQDVFAENALYDRLPKTQAQERPIWELDQTINDRGVCIDLPAVRKISATLDRYNEEMTRRLVQLTNGEVESAKGHVQLKKWLSSKGIVTDSVDKTAVAYLLSLPDLPDDVREVLKIRSSLGKSSVAKYKAMLTCAGEGDRVRGSLAFYGASTGRWAGRLLQVQNLPRPSGRDNLVDPSSGDGDVDEESISLLCSGNLKAISSVYKDINVLAADTIRGMIIPSKGHDLIVSDYSAVEGRGLAYLAGEQHELEAYASGRDIYKVAASSIFSIKYEEVDGGGKGPQRMAGKTATLACFAYNTRVVTDSGLKYIVDVTADDKVFDGQEFVTCEGFIDRGVKGVIDFFGGDVTPDHMIEVLEGVWMSAGRLKALADTTRAKRFSDVKELFRTNQYMWEQCLKVAEPQDFMPVGDILNCGPRHKYAVVTDNGEVIIAHNCGYSGGYGALCRFGFDKMPFSDEDAQHAAEVALDVIDDETLDSFIDPLNIPSEYLNSVERALTYAYKSPTYHDITKPFLIETKGKWIVKKWREGHPKTVAFWYDMKNAALSAMRTPNVVVRVGNSLPFCYRKNYLIEKLPSGRFLYYLDPKIEKQLTPYGKEVDVVTAMTYNSMTNSVVRRPLTIAILVENATQAFCRDLLREAMLRLEPRGYKIVASVHDELLAEVKEGKGSVEEFEHLMSITPDWAEGMPLKAAGGYISKRYRK